MGTQTNPDLDLKNVLCTAMTTPMIDSVKNKPSNNDKLQRQGIRSEHTISSGRYNEHALWGPGPEAVESTKLWNECMKNPGHKNFIPINKFGIHHVPASWQAEKFFGVDIVIRSRGEDIVKLVQHVANLTVRLRVQSTSPARPGDGGYYDVGTGGQRVGTGWIFDWELAPKPCPCRECRDEQGQRSRSWIFHIATAKHVVYDSSEAKATFVDFFYDYEDARKDGKMKTLMGLKVVNRYDEWDWCHFSCICHDSELFQQMLNSWRETRFDIERKRETLRDLVLIGLNSIEPKPVVIVSHPHGRPKCVTLGTLTSKNTINAGEREYSTETCPGSSGALLISALAKQPEASHGHHCQGRENRVNSGFAWN